MNALSVVAPARLCAGSPHRRGGQGLPAARHPEVLLAEIR